MKKQIIAGLLAATALAAVVKTVQEEVTTKGKALQDEMNTALEGKTGDERKKVLEDYTSRMNVIRSEAQNKLKASLDTALNEVAKEKGLGAVLIKDAVPQGGVDITEDVIAKMK